MSIMSRIFGQAPSTPNPNVPTGVQQPGTPLPNTQQSAQVDSNGIVPKTDDTVKSPLDDLQKLWDTPKIDPATENPQFFAGLDHKKVLESAKQNDFTKSVLTPELMASAAKGGQEGVAALVAAMNGMSQQVYAQSAIATTQIVEAALTKQRESFEAKLPSLVRNSTSREAMLKSNPLMGNPAVAPIADALQQTFQRKNPSATSDEIAMQVQDVFFKLSEAFAKKTEPTQAQKKAAADDVDWDALLSGTSNSSY